MKYDIIIGLEIHAELKTKSKMFCTCDNDSQGKNPNTNICPICLGHPGTLPIPNKQAIEWTILTGLALHCRVNSLSKFDRKNYYYPDLPKGYQISQFDLPLVYKGNMLLDGQKITITRIHLEEDTGKLTHPNNKNYSLVDYNRAGTPLMELVTEPVIHDALTAKKFCQTYQQILRYLDISNADMENGEMRCEANISLQKPGQWEYNGDSVITPLSDYKLNPKVELKNINSFKAIEKAINYEIERQQRALKRGIPLVQETRGWDADKAKTFSQRIKETSADYRYFPEPDIPALKISPVWIKKIEADLIEMPPEKKARFIEQYDFNNEAAEIIVSDRYFADFSENVISELRAWIDASDDSWERQKKKLARVATNWLTNELLMHLKNDSLSITNIKITPENFAELITLIYQEKINSSAGQQILNIMFAQGGDPSDIMTEQGLEQLDDETELSKIIAEIIKKNPQQADEFRSGKEQVIKYFIGQTMAATKGKANPKKVAKLFKEILQK